MPAGLQFPFRFDPAALRADLAKVADDEWSLHYNQGDYRGLWRGAALRSVSGATTELAAGAHSPDQFRDTPLLRRCPHFRQALAAFPCPLRAVRLLSLAPGAFIREHVDNGLDYEDGEIRIHIPIATNRGVEFYVAGERLLLEEGGCYYLNVNLPHRVSNRGGADRVHMVIDAAVDEWVHELFRRGRAERWHIPRAPLRPGGFEEFRRFAIETLAVREALESIGDRAGFAARAVQIARAQGFDFLESDVTRATCPDAAAPLDGWTPIRVFFRGNRPFAEWIYSGRRKLSEPFFDDSVRVALRRPFAALFRRETPLDAAEELLAAGHSLAPSGFIFHMSRCGSTLAAQMFAALPRTTVVSEAPAIDDAIQAARSLPSMRFDDGVRWLRWTVAALGQRRTGAETHYVVKLDSWHIHNMPLIRAAFPQTPWIFLHREPAEVLASQSRSPGKLALPGAMDPRSLGMRPEDITALPRDRWCAQVLSGFLNAAAAATRDPRALFVDYRELPAAIPDMVARHFGLEPTAEDREKMLRAAQFDAKNPGVLFHRDMPQAEPPVMPQPPSPASPASLH